MWAGGLSRHIVTWTRFSVFHWNRKRNLLKSSDNSWRHCASHRWACGIAWFVLFLNREISPVQGNDDWNKLRPITRRCSSATFRYSEIQLSWDPKPKSLINESAKRSQSDVDHNVIEGYFYRAANKLQSGNVAIYEMPPISLVLRCGTTLMTTMWIKTKCCLLICEPFSCLWAGSRDIAIICCECRLTETWISLIDFVIVTWISVTHIHWSLTMI